MEPKNTNVFSQICNTAILRSGVLRSKSYEDILKRLSITLIEYKNYSEFSKKQFVEEFNDFYKLKITKIVFGEIAPLLRKEGLIRKKDQESYYVNCAELSKYSYLKDYKTFLLQKDLFISNVVMFFNRNSVSLDKNEAETVLSRYIENSISSLGTAQESNDSVSDSFSFIIYSFIKYIKKENPELFDVYKNIIIGRMLATFVVNNPKITSDNSAFNGVRIYLDSGFVFNLLGLNNYSSKEEYLELVSILKGLGATFYIFKHVMGEICDIIDTSSHWVNNDEYMPSKSSKVTEFFLSHNYSKEDIEEYLYTLESKLQKLNISIIDYDVDYNEADCIYEADIKKMIQDEYMASGFYDINKDQTYELDAKSIYIIHKLRKRLISKTIKEAKHVFVTTNKGLARVANKYNQNSTGNRNIAYAITDTFLSVLLLFTYSDFSSDVSDRFFVPVAFHAFEPGKELIKKMEKVLEEMKTKGMISESDSISWKTSAALKNYVIDSTNNSPELFDEATPDKIMRLIQKEADDKVNKATKEADEMVEVIMNEADKLVDEAKKKRNIAINQNNEMIDEQISKLSEEVAQFNLKIGKKSKRLAKYTFSFVCLLLLGFVGFSYYLQTLIPSFSDKPWLIVLCCLLLAFILFIPCFIKFNAMFLWMNNSIYNCLTNKKKNKEFISTKNNEIENLKKRKIVGE